MCTREYGLGVDFICRDQEVIKNGGIHVIQTFFSEEKTEQIQIMGRCARQGQEGTYCLIINYKELDMFLGSFDLENKIKSLKDENNLYNHLSKARDDRFESLMKNINEGIKNFNEEKKESMEFRKNLLLRNEKIKCLEFLKKMNLGPLESTTSRIILLLDGTKSMGNLITSLKTNLTQMFERSSDILKENRYEPGCFEIQIAVYRNYDCEIKGILEVSPWGEPSKLIDFLNQIDVFGGGHDREEAVEIGLLHANMETKKNHVNQVILIGDAPANEIDVILKDRNQYGGEDKWKFSPFGPPTHWIQEALKLKENNVKVQALYLKNDKDLVKNFKQISNITGGQSKELVLKKNMLTDMITQIILASLDTENNLNLVKNYPEKYRTQVYF